MKDIINSSLINVQLINISVFNTLDNSDNKDTSKMGLIYAINCNINCINITITSCDSPLSSFIYENNYSGQLSIDNS
jgi:hypothetical protein